MLLLITGASGAGKSTVLEALRSSFDPDAVVCVEFDSIGVPPDADTTWRHGAVERWVQRAITEQNAGRHLVLCGQVPAGELLAAPSVTHVDGIAACLLHCSPEVRRERLVQRGENPDELHDHLMFGEWFYKHTLDPTHRPDVIRQAGSTDMEWDRWSSWKKGDPQWDFEIINTDNLTQEEMSARAVTWARETIADARSE